MGVRKLGETISDDDDISLADFLPVRGAIADLLPARHSTACCTDVALRRKFHVEPGHSFRRELDRQDDRVESLALWEEALDSPSSISTDLPLSSRGLESLFRKPPRKPSFFSNFFSLLPFSTSRRSRKS